MHIARRAIVSIAVLLASLSSILGQPHELLEVRLRSHVALLCADSLEGRKAGSEGGRMASEYIAKEWAAMGVEPLGQSYFHPFSLSRNTGRFHNVVARIEGEQSGSYIVVGAHYDHLGIVRGRIHPGADDNASGVAALLEVARLVAQSGIRPTHTLLFVAFDAEEKGLYGSEAFAKGLPEGSIRAMVNMDMVGWLHEGAVVVEGTGTLSGSQKVLTQLAERHNIPIETKRFERSLMTATDTSPFASRGIPTLSFNTGSDSPYHSPDDTPERIDYKGVAQIVGVVADLVAAIDSDPTLVASGRIAHKHSIHRDGLGVGLAGGYNIVSIPIKGDDPLTAMGWQAGVALHYYRGTIGVRTSPTIGRRTLPLESSDTLIELTLPLELAVRLPLGPYAYYLAAGAYYTHPLRRAESANLAEYGWQWSIGMRLSNLFFEATNRYPLSDNPHNIRTSLCSLGFYF